MKIIWLLIGAFVLCPSIVLGATLSQGVSDGQAEAAVWSSPEACEQAVKRGEQMAADTPSTLRLATWNLRWFPNGQTDDLRDLPSQKTDLHWLVCTIMWMHVDVLAIQESLASREANQAWDHVLTLLRKKLAAGGCGLVNAAVNPTTPISAICGMIRRCHYRNSIVFGN